MSVVHTGLLTVLLGLNGFHKDVETDTEREARLTIVATAITKAVHRATCTEEYAVPDCNAIWGGNADELEDLLVTAGKFESGFAQHIHEGNCDEDAGECDYGRAHSPWQLHASGLVPYEDWQAMHAATQEATDLGAWYAARVLISTRGCRTVYGMFSMYMTGRTCDWPDAAHRAAFFQRLQRQRKLRATKEE